MIAPFRRWLGALLELLCCLTLGSVAVAAPSDGRWEEAPLAPRSAPRGRTLFTALSPQQTGIVAENQFSDPNMWGKHYMEFTLGAMGTGVAIGDYDNDGKPDVFVVSKTESCRLFRNLGNWKFEEVTERAGLNPSSSLWSQTIAWVESKVGDGAGADGGVEAWKQGAVFADVDNDGWLDLYVCRFKAPNQLYINQRDGTFREEAAARGLAVVDASGVGAFCDYDRDGCLDVYIQTNMLDAIAHPNGQRGYLFRNQGDGTFANVTEPAGISGETLSHSAIWWDFDQDGWWDIYVANDFSAADKLYRNNRDGTFTNVINQVVPHMPYSAMGSDFGDINNDGRIDLLVADMAATTHEMDQRGMATSRSMNNQETSNSGNAPQYVRNALYLNTGVGPFQEAAILAGIHATDWTWSVRFEDLDNDGRLDLHVTNGMSREFHNSDLRDRILAAMNPAERNRVIRVGGVMAETHLAFRNRGDLQFESVGPAWGLDEKAVSFGAAFGDLDGDGDLDLVYANYQAGVSVFRNDSDSGHRLVVALRGKTSNRYGVGSTVRIETKSGPQVRALVLARGYLSSSEPILHFGLGNDTVIERLTVSWPNGFTEVFENLPVDRKLTFFEPPESRSSEVIVPPPQGWFAEVSRNTNLSVTTREKIGEESLPALLPVRQNMRGPGLAVGDLDGDGDDDVVVGGTSQEPARVLWRQTAGPFTLAEPAMLGAATALADGPVLIFDVNQDGRNDVLISKSGAQLPAGAAGYQPRLYWGADGGEFRAAEPAMLPALPVSIGAMAAADFDRDGRLDVFLGGRVVPGQYPLSPRSALWRNEGGRFTDVTGQWAPGLREPGMVTSALWSDVDGDGWLDLLVALEWGMVRCYHNEGGKTFTDWTERAGFAAAGTGWWSSLAAADFNGDGRPDYVAGNVGLNTPYQASPERPALLFLGDFAGGGRQIIEAYYEGDRLFPWRTRKDLGAKIPSILRRFTKNDAYAAATLPEILGQDRLDAAQRFAANQFQSGIFLSQADGRYRFQPLPRIAQIAPLQGIVTGDFDLDGYADIYAVQNSFAPIPSVGHFDGGLSQLLRGDGRGGFAPVPPADSGLVVPGDAKALVVLDLDGDGCPGLLLTRNNDATLAFRHRRVPGRESIGLSLRGPTGNPTAIGARVTLELSDGTAQTCEVAAGSGYYSQSSAVCFFGYPKTNLPRRVSVRWPSGNVTRSDLPPGVSTFTVSAPRR